MEKISVTKEFTFDMAHALDGYDGKCRFIHGHTFHLEVTVAGVITDEPGNPKNGMVFDFSELKRIVKHEILDVFDHALVLNENSRYAAIVDLVGDERIVLVSYQPTSENLLLDFKNRLLKQIPSDIELQKLRLRETPTSIAEWDASDNRQTSELIPQKKYNIKDD